jgi:hypothetical protein
MENFEEVQKMAKADERALALAEPWQLRQV